MFKPIELPGGDTLDVSELMTIVIALSKAATTSHPEMAVRMRAVAFKIRRQMPAPFDVESEL